MRILFTGGGTGGHFYPIFAVIEALKNLVERERILDLELFFMGPALDEEQTIRLKNAGVVPIPVAAGKLRRYAAAEQILDFLRMPLGIAQAIWNMFCIMPDVVFSKGGYGAFPAVAAAALFRIPLIIHESDAVPGIVNVLSRYAAYRIGIAFASAAPFFSKTKTALVGVPVRKRIIGGDKTSARAHFGISSALPVVGIIGGSQGAEKLNEAVMGALRELTDGFEIIHQTGVTNLQKVEEESRVILEFAHHERYHLFGFLDEDGLRAFSAVCDIIVSRAGASAIYELAAWGIPAILVPLDSAAQNHQRKNAYEYAGAGAAFIIEETNLTPHILLAEIRRLIADKNAASRMRIGAQKFARLDSAALIAREILQAGMH
ncbi:MAG: glycosyltransferase [Patescibacteria group bacterium]